MTDKQKTVVALGKFDGIHKGHAKLISTTADIAADKNMRALVYNIGVPSVGAITSKKEKNNLIKDLGINDIRYRAFDDSLRQMLPEEFVKNILKDELNAGCVVVGYNFKFGKDRCADSNKLVQICKKYDIDVEIIDAVCIWDASPIVVSSSLIRTLIASGRVKDATDALGRPYSLCGRVNHGKHLGTSLGFPTMNIYPSPGMLIPARGVYLSRVTIDAVTYRGVTNVGVNPTVEDSSGIKIETHILDFDGDCYGKDAVVTFDEFLREERHFESIEELKKQVKSDIEMAYNRI